MLKALALAAALCGQAPQPQLWQLADSTGTVWQHADPAYLSRWVAERNAALPATRPPSPFVPRRFDPPFGMWRASPNYYQLLWGSSPCAGGNCSQ